MYKKVILLSVYCLCVNYLFGQQDVNILSNYDKTATNQTTSLTGGRWEFFMSEIAAQGTYRIDKYTGKVYVLVKKDDETLTWDLVEKEAGKTDVQNPGVINYQLFASGLAMRYTFLLNTNTGLTWQLVADENKVLSFQLIE